VHFVRDFCLWELIHETGEKTQESNHGCNRYFVERCNPWRDGIKVASKLNMCLCNVKLRPR